MATRDRERLQETSARQKLQKDLDDLRIVMATKSSEDNLRREADRSREAEMIRLRENVVLLQKTLDEHRENAQQLANRLRVDVEALRQSHTAAQRNLSAAQDGLREKEKTLGQLQSEANKADNLNRQVAAELTAARQQLAVADEKLRDEVQARDVSDHTSTMLPTDNRLRRLIGSSKTLKTGTTIWRTQCSPSKTRRPTGRKAWSA